MKPAYYNEIDEYAAQWLRNLIAKKLIAPGDVDTRSIVDVQPDDLRGYAQCHFFAGIAGWSLAARLAGWPDDKPLWTGSAPCQPFSVAGKQLGQDDERHLWPHYFRLIRAHRPDVCVGEQVAAAVGKDWLDGVSADLEGIGYACGAAVVPACAVDAPHRRDRIWFVGRNFTLDHRDDARLERFAGDGARSPGRSLSGRSTASTGRGGVLAYSDRIAVEQGCSLNGRCDQRGREESRPGLGGSGSGSALVDADVLGSGEERQQRSGQLGRARLDPSARSAWSGAAWLIGHDGKARRIEPSIRLLAHGVPARVGKLRAYGNAIVPEEAAQVLGAILDVERSGDRPAHWLSEIDELIG